MEIHSETDDKIYKPWIQAITFLECMTTLEQTCAVIPVLGTFTIPGSLHTRLQEAHASLLTDMPSVMPFLETGRPETRPTLSSRVEPLAGSMNPISAVLSFS